MSKAPGDHPVALDDDCLAAKDSIRLMDTKPFRWSGILGHLDRATEGFPHWA